MINEGNMTLGTDYKGQHVTGWVMTEKLDGCRAYWDGRNLWTRGGSIIKAPEWFTKNLPEHMHLDGEIWAGRGQFETAKGAVQFSRFGDAFNCPVQFVVFDTPEMKGSWETRMEAVGCALKGVPFANPVGKLGRIHDVKHLFDTFNSIKRNIGEGLMLRNPEIEQYETGRTENLLKVKYI